MSYKLNYRGVGEMLKAEFMQAEMRRRAEKVKAYAESIAPDYDPTGAGYKFEFEVDSGVQRNRTKRAFGRVTNRSPHALWVEFGGRATPRHRVLGRALDAAAGD